MIDAYKRGFMAMCQSAGVDPVLAEALYKHASSDPALDRSVAIFKDWLTNRKHVVRNGEVLSGIARKYNMSLDELKEANNMTSSYVKPGQTLKIPVGSNKKCSAKTQDKC